MSDVPTRRYESRLRQGRAEETKERIVAAAAELALEQPGWDQVTVTAIAERAGVGRRTVYRHFESQAALQAAIEAHLWSESDIEYRDLGIDDLPEVATHVFARLEASAAKPWAVLPVAFPTVEQERRDGLRHAARQACEDAGSEIDPELVAAALEVIWQVPSFEILRRDWDLDEADAMAVLRWLHGLVERALGSG